MRKYEEEISNTANISCIRLCYIAVIFVAPSVLAQDTPHSEEYMQQHDGGDRAEYLEEAEHNDPPFYVPPVNDTSLSTTTTTNTNNSIPSN